MAQFSLYKNEDSASNDTYPYFIDIQNPLLSDLNSRLVIPLSSYGTLNNTDAKRLCPVIHLDEGDFVLLQTSLIPSKTASFFGQSPLLPKTAHSPPQFVATFRQGSSRPIP
ncbi:MAG: CcdB family protein [Sedimenticola sp.]